MWKSSIQVVHRSFQTLDTTNVQNNFTNNYLSSWREYSNLRTLDTTSIQSNFKNSSYVYLPYNPLYIRVDEGILAKDIVLTNPVPEIETPIIFDNVVVSAVTIRLFSVKTVINGAVRQTYSVKTEMGQTSVQIFGTKLGVRQFSVNPVTTLP